MYFFEFYKNFVIFINNRSLSYKPIVEIMFVDSHCHLNYPGLIDRFSEVLCSMRQHRVSHALCVSVSLERFTEMMHLVDDYDHLFASVGIHPDESATYSDEALANIVEAAKKRKIVAIGETGLDYFRMNQNDTEKLQLQHKCFRGHIQAAKIVKKPLIIHTRSAASDTISIMKDENASDIGGVIHCFTEDWAVAKIFIDMGFYISISGIVTFNKNTEEIREVVRRIPLNRLLIETDAPFLSPVPVRGKVNEPSFVRYVAQFIANLRKVSIEKIAEVTSDNFFQLFRDAQRFK